VPARAAVAEDRAADGFRACRADITATRPASATCDSVALRFAVYLLDTNVVSELRKPRPNPKVIAWIQDADDPDLHLSAVTIGEIQAGIEVTRTQNPTKAGELEAWAGQVADSYNVLAMDAACFRRWAKLMHRQSSTVYEEAMIAATALVHDLTVVTRNVRDFSRFDVPVLNPFE
jgi:predicted nucleic acid-binding protein